MLYDIPVPGPQPSVHDQLEQEFACRHSLVDLTRFIAKNGAVHFRLQCARCGKSVKSVRKSVLNGRQLYGTKRLFNRELNDKWHEKRWARYTEIREQREAERQKAWFEWYDDYLTSPDWHRRRHAVMQRSGGRCESCGKRPAKQVHHLSYGHVGNEPLFDLAAVCEECHRMLHQQPKAYWEE